MPDLGRFGSKIPVRPTFQMVQDLRQLLVFRAAMFHPSWRIEAPQFDGTDWEAVIKKDAEDGRLIWSEINRVTGNLYADRERAVPPPTPQPVWAATRPAGDPQLAHDLNDFWRLYHLEIGIKSEVRDRLVAWANAHPNDGEAQFVGAVAAEASTLPSSEQYKRLADQLRHACDLGYAPAYSMLAMNYEMRGDYETAIGILRRGVELNDPRAAAGLGKAYLSGKGVKTDFARARSLFQKSLDGGWDEGYTGLAGTYLAQRQMALGLRALEAGASAKVPTSMCELALLKLSGPRPDQDEAFRMMKQAAEIGQPRCERYLGLFYENGTGTTQDSQKAIEWLNRAAMDGDMQSVIPLSDLLLKSKDATAQALAVNALSQADAAGSGEASYHLALLYVNCKDKARRDLARVLLQRAIQRGVSEAAAALRKMDQGSDKDRTTRPSMKLLEPAESNR